MEENLIKIGNSKGVILPNKLLKLIGLKEKVNITIRDGEIIISQVTRAPREGWEDMLREETEKYGQSEKLMPEIFEDEEADEWTW